MYQFVNIFGKPVSIVIVMYLLGGLCSLINFMLKRRAFNYSVLRAGIFAVFFISIGMVELKAMGLIRSGVLSLVSGGEYVPDSSVRIFGVVLFQPLAAFLISVLFGDKFRKVIDSFTAETYIYFAFGKLSCHLKGCCHGFPYENGVMSYVYGGKVFPVQLLETLCVVAVVIIVVIMTKKKDKFRTGTLFPVATILYCIGRFIWEYCRYYESPWEKNLLPGMNFWQICCVLAIIMSAVWLIVLYASPKYATCSFDADPDALGSRLEVRYYKWQKERKKAQKKKAKKTKVKNATRK